VRCSECATSASRGGGNRARRGGVEERLGGRRGLGGT
jgi:hypothetical protein